MKRITLALAFALVAVLGPAKTVSAQEILLEGPLAGEPAVRKLVKYREMRFSVGPLFAYTLLNDYMHNFLLGARLEFNILEWLSVGLVGYYSFNYPTKLTQHISESTDIGGSATVPSESNYPSYTGAANFEDQVARLKGEYLLQIGLTPLRGKLSLFEKLFVAVDGYIFLGGGIVQYEQRKDCSSDVSETSPDYCGDWQNPKDPELETRIYGAVTLGIGFMVYFNEFIAVNLEYRMTPFKWNAGGTDEAGSPGSEWVLSETEEGAEDDLYWDSQTRSGEGSYPDGNIDDDDRTWYMNQSIAIGVIFYFPTTPKVAN